MARGVTFNALDVSEEIGNVERGDVAAIAGIARIMKRLVEEGHFRRFGYRRTLVQDRTQTGVMTTVAFAPQKETPKKRVVKERVRTSIKARAEEARPFAYLGLSLREARRLERQTQAIREQTRSSGQEVLRLGELLLAVEALVGPSGTGRYVEDALSMSRDTARRLMRVARTFKGDPRLESIAAVRPVVLYKLTEPSFPTALRDVILKQGGLVVDGKLRPLEALRGRDLSLAKRAWLARIGLEKAPDPKKAEAEALEGIAKGASRLVGEIEALPEPLRREGAETLRKLLDALEKKGPER
jgi:hypothetical protein